MISNRERVRSFVAIELSEAFRSDLALQVEVLRRTGLRGLRLVRPEGIHLTLKFLGEMPGTLLPRVVEALTRVSASHRPFALELGQPGSFPSRERARVVWVGVGGDIEALHRLQRDVDEEMSALGFPKEDRDFTPHLTVARLRDEAASAERRRAAETHESAWRSTGARMRVEGVSLMQSHLRPEGAHYERLALFPLEAGLSGERCG